MNKTNRRLPSRSAVLGLLFLPALFSIAAVPQLRAAAYFTAKTGSDSNPGSLAAPFLTIKKGIGVMRSGDTLSIRAGTYAESLSDAIPSGASWSAPTTLAAYPGDTVILRPPSGAGRVVSFSNARYIVLDGFIMDGANLSSDGIKISHSGSNTAEYIRVKNSEVKNSPAQGILVSGESRGNEFINLKVHTNGGNRGDLNHGMYIEGANNLVDHCDIYNNAGKGIQIYHEGGGAVNDNVVRYNKIHDNARLGQRGVGIILSTGFRNKAHDNLIWNNSGGIQVDYGSNGAMIFNNTIYSNNGNAAQYGISLSGSGTNTLVRNNIVFKHNGGNIAGSQSGQILSNNLTSDPLFVNAAGLDFHLKAGSPAIDAGMNLSAQGVTVDFAGTPRPVGSAYDIGAYEYGGTGGLPSADTAAPVISGVAASAVSGTGATIGWTTNEAADTQVEYGPTAAYGATTPLNSALSINHSAVLSGLTAGTLYHYRAKSKDAAGNLATSPDATFTASASSAAPPAAGGCVSSAGTWANTAVAAQSGVFTAEFDGVPGTANMDGVSGLSNAAAADYAKLAAAVRFNNAGTIDARNGGAFGAAAAIPYVSGLTYRFRLVVSVPAHTYSAYVKQGANAEILIGSNYAFRTEQAAVTTLNNVGLYASAGSMSVCGAAATASGAAADTTAPVLSGVAASAVSASGATIGWTTNEAADTQVEYGPTAAYGASTPLSAALAVSHSAVLSGLTAGTLYHYRVKSKDAAGNLATSADATFTTGVSAPSAGCVNSAGAWANAAVAAQSGVFTAEFDGVPGKANMDGVAGLSNAAAGGYAKLAAAVRFNNAGTIDARNGGAFGAAAAIPYVAGLTYRFRLVVSVPAHTYSAYVKQGANAEILIGSNYAFRTEQAAVTTLNNVGLYASAGSLSVCGAAATASGPAADATAPVISGVAASAVSGTGATIGWTTNEAADTQVEYGPTAAYGASTPLNAALTVGHSAVLSGLSPGTVYHYRVKSKDAAGNLATSPDATFTTAATAPPAAACVNSAGAWTNTAIAAQSGAFTAEFDAVPGTAKMDGVTGLSNAAAANYAKLAAAVRFNNGGTIDARNGGAYASASAIPYAAGLTYHFRLVVNVPAHTYSAYVKQGANAEALIGSNYAFRTEQAAVAALNNVGLFASSGSMSVCNAAVK